MNAARIVLASAALAAPAFAQEESDYYTVEYYPAPDGARLEVGGMDFLPDGSLVLSTRRGQVWMLENPEVADVSGARWSLFAEGLWEGLGLKVVDGELYVLQRGELSRLRDVSGDGRCDHIDTVANGWGLSENYHEFAFGLPLDDAGNFVMTLNIAFINPQWWHGQSVAPYRGWAMKVSPLGEITPWAYGFRSPAGVGKNAAGDLFVTDNQGDWCPSSPIYHLVEGGFYGHPASLKWTDEYRRASMAPSDSEPPPAASRRRPAAVWIPYEWSRSTGNLVPDLSDGAFGPFAGQLMVAELTNGMVLRADLEKVRGEYQGWVQPFRREVGSVSRVIFGSDGTLYCGMTNRGWGGRPPADGLARVRWTGRTPMEIQRVELLQGGFRIGFTRAVGADVQPADISIFQYDYNYWWEYGSPPQNQTPVPVVGAELSGDRKTLTIQSPGLRPAMIARVTLAGLSSEGGEALLHPEFAYTINQLPEGPLCSDHVAKVVPPPPEKETSQKGWLMLSWVAPMDRFEFHGWELVSAELDRSDPRRFAISEGQGALVNTGEAPSHYLSRQEFADCKLQLEFMLPKGGNSGVYLMGRYEVQLLDSEGITELGFGDCGGIYRGVSWPGQAPRYNGFRTPGEWHKLELEFHAPRFDDGRKVRDARFVRVAIDGIVVQEDVGVPEPTARAMFRDEARQGPLMLQGDHGPVAFRDIRVLPLTREPQAEEGWLGAFPEELFDEWILTGDAEWELDGETIISYGGMGHLFSPRGDFDEFDLRAEVKISDGGNSGLYFRAQLGPGWPKGYEAQVNSSFPDPQRSGSLYNLSAVEAQLVPPNTWFDYFVSVRDQDQGTRIRILVNGVLITDFLDTERRHGPGHIALQQHHEGSVVNFRRVEVRPFE